MLNVTPGQNSAVCLGHDRFSQGIVSFLKYINVHEMILSHQKSV